MDGEDIKEAIWKLKRKSMPTGHTHNWYNDRKSGVYHNISDSTLINQFRQTRIRCIESTYKESIYYMLPK